MPYTPKAAVYSEKLTSLKTKRNPLYISNQSVPRCKHHRYKNQSVNAVYTKGRCLYWEINLSKDQTQSALYKQSVRTAL